MAVDISDSTIKKLTHESGEIRLRTLEQIDAKIQRALAHNEAINFKPSELTKQLIRWFGFIPPQEPARVLRLLSVLLRSSYKERAIEGVGVNRLLKEMKKVEITLRKHKNELTICEEICYILNEYQQKQRASVETLADSLCHLSVNSERVQDVNANFAPEDYEVAWSTPSVGDYNALRNIADVLVNKKTEVAVLQNTLQRMQVSLVDYPAEFMLQAPEIFLNLLYLYESADDVKSISVDVSETLLVYLKMLRKRLVMRRKTSAYAALPMNSLDAELQPRTQLSIAKTLELLLAKCLDRLQMSLLETRPATTETYEILWLAMDIYGVAQLPVDSANLHRLGKLCEILRSQTDLEGRLRIERIKYLIMIFLLQDMGAKRGCDELLEPMLKDFALKIHFPARYARLSEVADTDLKIEKLARCEASFAYAIALLKDKTSSLNSAEIIRQHDKLSLVLDKLRSKRLVELIFNAIVACCGQFAADAELKADAISLILHLLQLSHEPLKVFAYSQLVKALKKHLNCLMNGESYSTYAPNGHLLEAQIIGVPLDCTLLLYIINESFESGNAVVKEICEDVLVRLLQAQHLMEQHWGKLLELLLPVLPLMQCCVYSSKLTQLLLELFDPDAPHLPVLNLLQGNICFLFNPNEEIRSEALTRLIYMVSTFKHAKPLLPEIAQISDLIPSDLCVLKAPRSYNCIFNSTAKYTELSTLRSLLEVLDAPNVDPLIRKSTLMQLNAMCQSWEMTQAFCGQYAHCLVILALENSLQKQTYMEYADAAIPAVGVITKLLFYDREFRDDMASKKNMYVLLLRALWYYLNDIQVQQDASICLFQLVFHNFLVVIGPRGVEVPSIMGNLMLPVKCEFKITCQSDEIFSRHVQSLFSDQKEEILYLRQVIATNFCGGAEKVTFNYLEAQKQQDISSDLLLTERDWYLFKSTNSRYNLNRFLTALANATSHKAVINACISIQFQLLLIKQEENHGNVEALLSRETCAELYEMLRKHLQQAPGNATDFMLYEHILDLSVFCMRLPLPSITWLIFEALQSDFQHTFINLLKNPELPLRILYKLCMVLQELLTANYVTADASILYSNLFELLAELCQNLLDTRKLEAARCMLSLVQLLSAHNLQMSDKQLFAYCQTFICLSITLKLSTQTGSQWHRDCLRLLIQLIGQMQQPAAHVTFPASTLKYLSGLCGHSDIEVRALAWSVLAYVPKKKVNELLTSLEYLPGGFMSCCLSTLMDGTETILVRQLAGQLFAQLLTPNMEVEPIISRLYKHRFFEVWNDGIKDCLLEIELPPRYAYQSKQPLMNCDIISCFCRVIIQVVAIKPDFVATLSETYFIFKLCELFKQPCAKPHPAYHQMCADVCQLYAIFYSSNFSLLQRTLCRDHMWLSSFCKLVALPQTTETLAINVLQLLLVLCKDTPAYRKLCGNFTLQPRPIIELFINAFSIPKLNTSLQRSALAALSFMLIKAQEDEEDDGIIAFLSRPTEISPAAAPVNGDQHKENDMNCMNKYKKAAKLVTSFEKPPKVVVESSKKLATETEIHSAAALLYIELQRLFLHVYPTSVCKFKSPPTAIQIALGETLAVFLKLSTAAQEVSCDLRLLSKMLRLLKTFFDEFNTNCHTFIRRYGESKKVPIIKHFKLFFNIILNWYSSPNAVLTDEGCCVELCRILLHVWPWLTHSAELKLLILQCCAFLSERSLLVCVKFSSLLCSTSPSASHSIAQLVIKIVTFETTKVKAASTVNFPVIFYGLRIIMNCCSTIEGRVALVKARILDTFDGLYPFNPKSPKIKLEILHYWLQFWELFSRYTEGAQATHLNALCAVINNLAPLSETRLASLKILRNMCFLANNRTTLMNSMDFIFTVNAVIGQPYEVGQSVQEQMIVSVGIWRLISGGVKYVTLIRGTKLAKKFRILREQLTAQEEQHADSLEKMPYGSDLLKVLDIMQSYLES